MLMWCVRGGAVCVYVFSFSILFALSETTFFPMAIFSEHYFLLFFFFFPFALFDWVHSGGDREETSPVAHDVRDLN